MAIKQIMSTAAFVVGLAVTVVAQDLQKALTAVELEQYRTAIAELSPLAKQGNAEAQYHFGSIYFFGRGVPHPFEDDNSAKQADYWYKLAFKKFMPKAKKGEVEAQYYIGDMYLNGWGVEKDYDAAIKWLTRSARKGNAKAEVALGLIHQRGLGVPRDVEKAIKWYKMAANQDNGTAMVYLGWIYQDPQYKYHNLDLAEEWFVRATKLGDVFAMTQMVRLYAFGKLSGGRPKNMLKKIFWHRKAARKGLVSSQVALALYYGNRMEDEQYDPKRAFKWSLAAAKHGDASAQYMVGHDYLAGEGIHKDYNEAFKWFWKSSRQGDDASQHQLGYMYEDGKGVAQSNIIAYMWFNLASMNDNPNSYSEYSATAERNRVAKKLSALEIQTAQDMSTKCFNSSYKNCGQQEVFANPAMLTMASYLGSAEFCAAYGVDYRETASMVIAGINRINEFDDTFTKTDFNIAVEKGHFGEIFSAQAKRYVSLSKESADIFESCKTAHLQVIKISKAK